jgi:hypothetical protein
VRLQCGDPDNTQRQLTEEDGFEVWTPPMVCATGACGANDITSDHMLHASQTMRHGRSPCFMVYRTCLHLHSPRAQLWRFQQFPHLQVA